MEQNWGNFLLEHYTQVSEHLRESDRKRDILFGVYTALVAGILSFVYSTNNDNPDLKLILLGFLIIFGIGLAFYTTIARAWHCEYVCVAIAIHKAFLETNLDLYKAAKELKESNKVKPYFERKGIEFIMMVFVLLFIFSGLILLFHELWRYHSWPIWLIIVLAVISFVLLLCGLKRYGRYLSNRVEKFPDKVWSILEKKN